MRLTNEAIILRMARLSYEKVHFEAVSAKDVKAEMDKSLIG
jgi:hypothetical protein